jgi:hypothetical protein
MFRYESFIRPDQLEMLKRISKTKWYSFKFENNEWLMLVNKDVLLTNGMPEHVYNHDKHVIHAIYTVVESMRIGPKVIEPTFEQCLALENTELRIPYDTYKQIFPVVITELPQRYREYVREKYNQKCPKYVFSMYDPVIAMNFVYNDTNIGDLFVTLGRKDELPTIEDHFSTTVGHNEFDPDLIITKLIERIVINMNLILTNYGHVSKGMHRLGGKKHRDETQYELIAPIDQMIKMHEVKSYEDKGSTHASPRPHWRKGHWRNQSTNSGHVQRFIKPIFVCGYKATGHDNVGIYTGS